MKLKAITGIVLTVLLIGMLTLAFNIQQAESSDGGYALAGDTHWHTETVDSEGASENCWLYMYGTVVGGTTDPLQGINWYPQGTIVKVTAYPFQYWHFYCWEIDMAYWNYSNPIYITMDTNHTVTVYWSYDVIIEAHCNTEGVDVSVGITMDSEPTGENTPHTFTGFVYGVGQVFTVPITDPHGCPFKEWTGPFVDSWDTSIGVMGGGVYTAYYEAPPPYDVTIKAHCNTEGVDVSVSIDMDGSPTGYTTPHTFTNLTGTRNFTVPDTDPLGHPFNQWSTGETSTTITISSDGTYTAYYGAGPPVGGVWVPVDKFGLLAPYIALASTILVATAATAIYVKRRKKKE